MKIVRRNAALRDTVRAFKKKGLRVGFVPTMGALHEGHLSLLRLARRENDRVVASIFVNPLQFGPGEDFRRYPRDLKRDRRLLEKAKTDLLFLPENQEMYPEAFQSSVSVRRLSRGLCGVARPAHFSGVATVVLKLLNAASPDVLYLGQKDYQQFRVVSQMVKDLGLPVRVRLVPTRREKDGLAMSSRNAFLKKNERSEAVFLYKSLKETAAAVRRGERDARALRQRLKNGLKKARSGRVEYAEIADAATLEPMVKLKKGQKIMAAVAVRFPHARLIDNLLIQL